MKNNFRNPIWIIQDFEGLLVLNDKSFFGSVRKPCGCSPNFLSMLCHKSYLNRIRVLPREAILISSEFARSMGYWANKPSWCNNQVLGDWVHVFHSLAKPALLLFSWHGPHSLPCRLLFAPELSCLPPVCIKLTFQLVSPMSPWIGLQVLYTSFEMLPLKAWQIQVQGSMWRWVINILGQTKQNYFKIYKIST